MTKDYDYFIETYRIDPPVVHGLSWGAKAKVKRVGTGRADDIQVLREQWGKTEDEARSKAEAEARQWMETHR